MSLINNMLRDLDARNAAPDERKGLADQVRALPAAPERFRLSPLLVAPLAALLGAGAMWFFLRAETPAPPPAPAASVTPAPIPAIAPEPVETVMPPPAGVTGTTLPEAPTETPAETSVDSVRPPGEYGAGSELVEERPHENQGLRQAQPERRGVDRQFPTGTPAAPSSPATPAAEAAAPLRLDPTLGEPQSKAAAAPPRKAAAPAKPAPKVKPAAPETAPAATVAVEAAPEQPSAETRIAKHMSAGVSETDREYQRGLAAIKRGNSDEGSEALRAVLRLEPMHVGARQALLALLSEQRRWNDVETLALAGVDLMPRQSGWALLAARLMYERGDTATALATLDRHAAAAKQNADYQVMRALLQTRAGRNTDAADSYRTALALRPNEGRWWFGLGRALDADQQEAAARAAYENAINSGNLPPELQQAAKARLQ
ncbi:MAG: hypothetical protein LBE62_07690 [Azonexus sp.]|jgi:MSHA biogenesis protein MshN|nr:hypothetical protein [Azonexus sp.]